jgi:branched-chain amino acid transport system substrate-binding protein
MGDPGNPVAAHDTTVRTAESATEAPAGEPIRIGGTLGLTGPFAEPSAGYHAAYQFWAATINRSGGLLGRPVELVIYDDVSTPDTARSLYQRLVDQDDVDLLVAPYSTVIGEAVLPVAERNRMVLFNGGFVGVDLFRTSDWMVGTLTSQEPDHTRGVFGMIDALPAARRPQRIGIATARNPFTLAIRDGADGTGGVRGFARRRGIDVVVDEEYVPGAADLGDIIAQAQTRDVDLFFALALPSDGAVLARAASSVGFAPDIYCACGAHVVGLPSWTQLGPAGDGIMSTAMAWHSDDYPALDDLYDHARWELGYPELSVELTSGFATMQVVQQAVEGVGEIDQVALRAYATGRSIDTVVGPLSFDEHGIPGYASIVVQDVGDHHEVVWPPERATAEPSIPPTS